MPQQQFFRGFRHYVSVLFGLSAVWLGTQQAMSAEHPGLRTAHAGDLHNISQMVTHIDDMEVAVQVTQSDNKELEKIGKDFGNTYRFRHLTLQYKQPGKIRLEAHSPVFGAAVLIMNGPNRFYSVPKLHLKNTENLENAPAKRLSLLEYLGVVAPDTLRYMAGHFVKEEDLEGTPTVVYDMNYSNPDARSSYRLWINPKTHITMKREWYDSEKRLRATFTYADPQEVTPGIWLPGRVEVKNAEGVVAATTTCSNVKLNQGLDDSLFTPEP